MNRTAAFAVVAPLLVAAPALAQLRIVAYNTLDHPTTSSGSDSMSKVLSAIGSESVNGIASRIGVMALEEQTTTSSAYIANRLNALYGVTTYQSGQFTGQQNFDRLGFVYDASKVTVQEMVTVASNGTRPIGRVKFQPVGYNNPSAAFYLYVVHLNATNLTTRATETASLRANVDALGAGSNAIVGGDYNMDASTEQGYVNLSQAGGNGRLFDPINRPGTWTANSSFASIHTQSTRLSDIGDGGATGGVDDRFDLQLMTASMLGGEGVSYIGPTAPGTGAAHSYRAFGNNGSVYNKNINDVANTSKPKDVLDALQATSDHLPLVTDIQVPAVLTATVSAPTRVLRGATATATVTVTNAANVVASVGADELDWTLSGSGNVSGNASGTTRALQAAGTGVLALNTTSLGVKSGTITPTTASRGAQVNTASLPVQYEVVRSAIGSFGEESIVDESGRHVIVPPNTASRGEANRKFEAITLFALGEASDTAALDLDSIFATGDAAAFDLNLETFKNLLAGSSATFTPELIATLPGEYEATYTLSLSDEDLPGETRGHLMTITLAASVVPEPGMLALSLLAIPLLRRRR